MSNSPRTSTLAETIDSMRRRNTSTLAETTGFDAELRMHVTFTRAASGAARHHDRQPAHVRIRSRTARV
jgi:hypothetical protein